MADVTFSIQGNVDNLSKQQDGGAVLRLGQALFKGLAGNLKDVGTALELEIAAGILYGSPDEPQASVSVEPGPQLLLVVAGTLTEMVGTLLSDIKGNAGVQKLLPAIQKFSGTNQHAIHDLFQELMISKQPPDPILSCLVGISPSSEEMQVCISNKDSRTATRSTGKCQGMCTYTCAHHPELVDSGLWRRSPQELVELVFAILPLPRIFELCESPKAWSALSKSSNFRQACSEGHPKLSGLVGFNCHFESTWTRIHDINPSGFALNRLVYLEEMVLTIMRQSILVMEG